jgi:hypothetical protein
MSRSTAASTDVSGISSGLTSIDRRLNTGLPHINDQTVKDDVVSPFGACGARSASV